MIVGETRRLPDTGSATADSLRLTPVQFTQAARIPKVVVYADTLGAVTTTSVRGVVYDDVSSKLLGAGDEVLLPPNMPPTWVDLPLVGANPGGVDVPAAALIDIGLHVGGSSLHIYRDLAAALSAFTVADTYSDGSPAVLGTRVAARPMSVYVPTFPKWAEPQGELEVWYARLPWPESQQVFYQSPKLNPTVQSARVAWHGTALNQERGAFAVVQAGGKLDPLVGERVCVKVERVAGPEVYVYVHDVADIEQDISLPRRAFQELAFLGNDEIRGTVTRMA